MTPRTLYIVGAFHAWEKVAVGSTPCTRPDNGSVGFLHVFDDQQTAENYAGGKYEVTVIQEAVPA